MELIKSKRFEVWGWQAFLNFTLGGMATGFYILVIVYDFIYRDTIKLLHPNTLKLIPPILVVLGFIAVATEAGKPARGLYLINNLRMSWMSRETAAGVLFISAAVADCIFPHVGLRILAVAAASGFLLSQGFIIYYACATPAWNVSAIPVYFIISGFSMGFGLWLLLSGFGKIPVPSILITIGLVIVILTLSSWVFYLRLPVITDLRQSSKLSHHSNSLIYKAGIGYVFAVLLLLSFLATDFLEYGVQYQRLMSIFAAAAILLTGARQKAKILLQFNYIRSIEIGQSKCSNQPTENPESER